LSTRTSPATTRSTRSPRDQSAEVRFGLYPPVQAEPTHSSDPSSKNWCFHTGRRSLMVSTSRAQVANAA
jgi:hypothetical protein